MQQNDSLQGIQEPDSQPLQMSSLNLDGTAERVPDSSNGNNFWQRHSVFMQTGGGKRYENGQFLYASAVTAPLTWHLSKKSTIINYITL